MKHLLIVLSIVLIPVTGFGQIINLSGGTSSSQVASQIHDSLSSFSVGSTIDSTEAGWGLIESSNTFRVDTAIGKVATAYDIGLKADQTAVDTLVGDNEFANGLALKLDISDTTAFASGLRGDIADSLRGSVPTYFIAASNATWNEKKVANVVCDGTADEVQINAALVAGYHIKLSTGQFNIAATITASVANVTIQGSGRGSTIVNLSAGSDCSVITIADSGWTIKDLYIDGNSADNTDGYSCGIRGVSMDNVFIDNVEITDINKSGVFIRDASTNWAINNSWIHDAASCCVFVTTEDATFPIGVKITNSNFYNTTTASLVYALVPENSEINLTIDNCNFTGESGYIQVLFDGANGCNVTNSFFRPDIQTGEVIHSGVRYYNGASGTVDNNIFLGDTTGTGSTGSSVGIWGGDDVIVSNNNFGKRRGGAIIIETEDPCDNDVKNVTVIGNTFHNSSVLALSSTIAISSIIGRTIQNVNIVGNTFLDDRGANAKIQYGIVAAGEGRTKNINISNNIMEGIYEGGIVLVADTCDNYKIDGNIFIDIPTGIDADEGVDMQITDNKFVDCATPIDVNDSDVTYPLIEGNTMRGCTNSGTYSGATSEIIGINVWHDGSYDATEP